MDREPFLSRRVGRVLLGLGIAAAVVFLFQAVGGGSGLAWLARGDAPYIVYPHVPRTTSHPVRALEAVFEREVDRSIEGSVWVDLRCLGSCRVLLDGRPFGGDGARLKSGSSTFTVLVSRNDGPPALSFALRERPDGPVVLASDTRWMVSQDGSVRLPAALGPERARPPPSELPAVPWLAVAGLALFGIAVWLAAPRLAARARWSLPVLVAIAWCVLLVHNLGSLPSFVGFDVEHHVFYLRFLLEHGAIPSPSDGVQTYQPPLFYLLSAAWLRLLDLAPGSDSAAFALRGLTFALGLAHLYGLYACVRILLPGREAAAALALVFAAAAPLHLALFHAFTNEALVATLSTAAVWALLRALRSDALRARHGLIVGVLVGAAVLSKLSALVLVPIALGALVVERPRSWAAPVAAASMLAVAGWYYAWIAREFGSPFVGNWDERVGFAWWQDPGVRDLTAYLSFGGALSDPWFAGFDSVWDGVYSTFYADGLASGEQARLLGPAWNHGLARVALWLGLIPTLLVAVGAVRGLVRVWRRPDATGLALVGLGVAMFTAFVFMTLRVPSYAQAKAIYWSPAFVVLLVAFALGVDTVRQRSVLTSRVVSAALCIWAAISFSVFWVDPDAPDTLRTRGEWALAAGRPEQAMRHFERAAKLGSSGPPTWAQVGACRVHLRTGQLAAAARACGEALGRAPDDPDALFHGASVARRTGDPARALELLEHLRRVAPLDERASPGIALVAVRLGRPGRAHAAAREWLRFDPGNREAIAILARPE